MSVARRNMFLPARIAVFLLLQCGHGSSAAPAPLVVNTTYGALKGYIKQKVRHFSGVPYAKPPVGALRWRPPQPPDAWSDTRLATQLPVYCAQSILSPPSPDASKYPSSEDCLYLNVVTPAEVPAKPMPVQLWIHGGGMKMGGSAQPLYAGDNLITYTQEALTEPVILVTFNYRLDVFGMLVQEDLVKEQQGGPLNYGLQDMCFVMEWVHDNIAKFGGDPARVMIHGESGGGWALTALLFADAGVTGCGKFHAAVGQSICNYLPMPYTLPSNTMAANLQRGEKLTSALKCSGKGVDCLRNAKVKDIFAAAGFASLITPSSYDLVIDGVLLKDAPGLLLQQGRFHKVPIIMGSCTNEGQLFYPLLGPTPKTLDAFQSALKKALPMLDDAGISELSAYYVAKYPPERHNFQVPAEWFVNDFVTKCSNLALAQAYSAAGVKSYIYLFQYEYNDAMKKSGVASHGCELSFVFGDTHSASQPFLYGGRTKTFKPEEQALADRTMGYFSTFAAQGDPNYDGAPARWPSATPETAINVTFGMNIGKFGALPDALDACALWEKLGIYNAPGAVTVV